MPVAGQGHNGFQLFQLFTLDFVRFWAMTFYISRRTINLVFRNFVITISSCARIGEAVFQIYKYWIHSEVELQLQTKTV